MIRNNNSVKVCLLGTRETLQKLVPGLSQLEQYGSTSPTATSHHASKFITTEVPIPLQVTPTPTTPVTPRATTTAEATTPNTTTTFVLHFKYPKYHDFNWNTLKWSEELIKMYDHIVCCYNIDRDKILVLGVDGMYSGFVEHARTKVGNDVVSNKFHFLLVSSAAQSSTNVIDELLLSQRELYEFKRNNHLQLVSMPITTALDEDEGIATTTTTTTSGRPPSIPLPLQRFLLGLPAKPRKTLRKSSTMNDDGTKRIYATSSTSAAPETISIAEETINELFEEPEEQVGPTHFTRFELLHAFKKAIRFIILAIIFVGLLQLLRPQFNWLSRKYTAATGTEFRDSPFGRRLNEWGQWWNTKWDNMMAYTRGKGGLLDVSSTTKTVSIPPFSVHGNAREVNWSRRNTTFNYNTGVLGLSSTITENSGISVHAKMLDSDLLTVSYWIKVIDSKKREGDDLVNFCNLNLHDRVVKLSIKNKPYTTWHSRDSTLRRSSQSVPTNGDKFTIAMQLGTHEMEHYMDGEFNYNQWYLLTLVNSPQQSTISMNFHHLSIPVNTGKAKKTTATGKTGESTTSSSSKLYLLYLDIFAHDYPLQLQLRNLSIWDRETFDVPSLLKRYIPLEDKIVLDWSRTIFNAGQLSKELFELKNLIALEEDKVLKAQKSYDIMYEDYHKLLQVYDTKSAELLKTHLLSRKEEQLQSYRDTLKKFENRRNELISQFETQFGISNVNAVHFESDLAATKSAISNTREMQDEFIETRFKNSFPVTMKTGTGKERINAVGDQAPIVQAFVKNV